MYSKASFSQGGERATAGREAQMLFCASETLLGHELSASLPISPSCEGLLEPGAREVRGPAHVFLS